MAYPEAMAQRASPLWDVENSHPFIAVDESDGTRRLIPRFPRIPLTIALIVGIVWACSRPLHSGNPWEHQGATPHGDSIASVVEVIGETSLFAGVHPEPPQQQQSKGVEESEHVSQRFPFEQGRLPIPQTFWEQVPPVSPMWTGGLQPVIGIMSGEVVGPLSNPAAMGAVTGDEPMDPTCHSYVAASYVSWVRGAGARVVPLVDTWPAEKLRRTIRQLNGVLLPGGTGSERYTKRVRVVIEEVEKINREGHYMPLWGTCLGFEMMGLWAAGPEILSGPASLDTDAENEAQRNASLLSDVKVIQTGLRLDFTPEGLASRMFDERVFPGASQIRRELELMNISHNDHYHGFGVERWFRHSNVSGALEVIATSDGGTGRFVSVFGGRAGWLPFFGVQFHPEKNIGEWNPVESINHGAAAVRANRHFADFFINEARRNNLTFHNPVDEEEAIAGFWGNDRFTGLNTTTGKRGFFDAIYCWQ